ncbi:hypothetical protein E1B28_009668 [Marasmius oreades]|uniref:Cytochrome P450 n=1 Tax=Marasmius oreades TaxID=181124 RepID=A0A9P7UQZ1_9AGAR|nr:uncharacterized protein E1B28_009668 [Marasmius oreades]KAG7090560.1 hypothetical protein E1B28_009668 [Marasmius oreades]
MDPTLTIGIAGVTSYFIFKRTETIALKNLFILLLVVPGLLLAFVQPTDTSFIQGVLSVLGYYITIIGCTLLYRLSPWHPLAAYPGPLVCKITKLKGAAVGRSGKQHLYYQSLHSQYGDVVRIGPNELSFLPVEAIDPILGKNGIPKGPFWDGRIPETQKIHSLLALRDLDEHKHRRVPWSKAFTTNALKEYEVLVRAKTDLFAERLSLVGKDGRSDLDIGEWFRYYTYDLMTDFVFSGGSNMLQQGDPEGLWEAIRSGFVGAMIGSHVPWLGRISYKLPTRFFNSGLVAFRNNSFQRAMKRTAEGSKRRDLYYYLLDEGNPDAKPNGPQAIADATVAVIGGSDTTSMTLTMILYYLISRPNVYQRLKQEIDATGDHWDDSTSQAKMAYLNGVINETLRLWPPALNGSQRGIRADASGKMILGGYVPSGTNVNIPFYSVHRDSRNFSPFPEEFIPERWLDEGERLKLEPSIFKNAEYNHDTQAFLAFSAGPANCVGRKLAMMEMRIVVCMLMKKFEVEFAKGMMQGRFEDTVLDYYTMQVGKLWVRLKEKSV